MQSTIPSGWPQRFNLCHYFLDHHVEEGRGERVALRMGKEVRTYQQLSDAARQLAAAFRSAGLRPEERVLFVLPDGFEFAEAWFACLRAGGVFAMVNPLLHAEDYRYYLEYTKARIVVTASGVLDELQPALQEAGLVEAVFVAGDRSDHPAWDDSRLRTIAEARAAHGPEDPLGRMAETSPDDLAGWLFTSGSTGKPKACVHLQRDFAYGTETYALQVAGYQPDDVCLSVPKLFFGYATGTNLMFPLRAGGSAVLCPERSTPETILHLIEEHRPILLTGVPTLIGSMLRSERIDEVDLSSLRVVLSAGEALPAALYSAWKERTGVEILDGIGSAEMFHIYISNRPGEVKLGSLGRIVPGYSAEVVDPEGRVLPRGESGRLRIRGGSTALCYWAAREKSIETFQGEWCTTADIFREDEEGFFYYEGRADDLLKVSGIWVSPLEIEDCLLAHDSVSEVCVVGCKDADDLVKPLAYVVASEGATPGDELAAELKAWLKERLAPRKYQRWFEWSEELPRNDRGRIARKDLRAEADQRSTPR